MSEPTEENFSENPTTFAELLPPTAPTRISEVHAFNRRLVEELDSARSENQAFRTETNAKLDNLTRMIAELTSRMSPLLTVTPSEPHQGSSRGVMSETRDSSSVRVTSRPEPSRPGSAVLTVTVDHASLPILEGTATVAATLVWISKVTSYVTALQLPNIHGLVSAYHQYPIRQFLHPELLDWFDGWKSGSKTTWSSFLGSLAFRLHGPDHKSQWRQVLKGRPQRPNETISAYHSDLYALAKLVYHDLYPYAGTAGDPTAFDAKYLKAFIKGAHPRYTTALSICKNSQDKSPNAWLPILLDLEKAYIDGLSRVSDVSGEFPSTFARKFEPMPARALKVSAIQGTTGTTGAQGGPGQRGVCFLCGSTQHYRSACPRVLSKNVACCLLDDGTYVPIEEDSEDFHAGVVQH
jgi:hypothetical protein